MAETSRASPQVPPGLRDYLNDLAHDWIRTLTVLAFTLVPLFFILDYIVVPPELIGTFAAYRAGATGLAVVQFLVLRETRPSRWSIVHGYLLTLSTGGAIALMTTHLGGLNSAYYAGLNLVIIAIVVLPPWGFLHSAANAAMVIGLWVGLNLVFPSTAPLEPKQFLNNLYFLLGTAIIAVSINVVKQRLIEREFLSRSDLKTARDALWGEMELAKQIQTSLLPKTTRLPGYRLAATMLPAAEVGGDYYDVLETAAGETWVAIGDVSGHGVESGLIMMMTQTSLFTTVNHTPGYRPSRVLELVNSVVVQNTSRLGTDRYMTLTAVRVDQGRLTFAGKHQDILVYRSAAKKVEVVPTTGTWIGIVEDLTGRMEDSTVDLADGDVVLLFTDGVTEAMDAKGRLYGEDRLAESLARHATQDSEGILSGILADVGTHLVEQEDDMTLLVLKRVHTERPSGP